MLGFVDCYIYIIYGGNCVCEFEMWFEGVIYEEVVCVGGGIVFFVKVINVFFVDGFVEVLILCVDMLLVEGVIMFEIKFGYGLNIEVEFNMLCVVCRFEIVCLVWVVISYFGVYVILIEYKGCNDDYIIDVVLLGLMKVYVKGFVDVVDGFCEGIVFLMV